MKAIDKTTKECLSCKQILPTALFYKQKQKSETSNTTWEYFDTICKKCRKEYATSRRIDLKVKAIKYKGGKCIRCGYSNITFPAVFDFHHLNPAEKDFSISSTSKSWTKITTELDKCILLCANCHRIEHSLVKS